MRILSLLGAAAALAAAALFLRGDAERMSTPRARPSPAGAMPDAPAPPREDVEAPREGRQAVVDEGPPDGPAIAQRFSGETDAARLDILQGLLAAHPEEADRAGVLEVFLACAAGDTHRARRQSALVYLGTAWDKDGRVLEVLLGTARAADAELRLTAISALQDYGVKNPGREAGLVEGLLDLARRDPDPVLRAQCLVSVPYFEPGAERAGDIARFLHDAAEEVRRAAAEKLASTPAGLWPGLRPVLAEASSRETQAIAREAMLAALAEGDARHELAGGSR